MNDTNKTDFLTLAKVEPALTASAGAAAGGNPYQAQISIWTNYNYYLADFAALLPIVNTTIDKFLTDKKAQTDMLAALQGLYAAAIGVNTQFINGINSMEGNSKSNPPIAPQAPQYIFQPVTIPAWPGESSGSNIFNEIWNLVQPVLQQVLSKISDTTSPFGAAVAGLLSAGQNVITAIESALNPKNTNL